LSDRNLAYPAVLRTIRRQHFAVLSTSDTAGHPASAGVTYGLARSGEVMYVMTRRHLQKARNIAANPEVSLVVPIPRRLLWPFPPATLQLRGHAKIIDWTDAEAREVFSGFLLGWQITNSYRELHQRGESRICFLRIDLDPVIRTYLFGTSIWRTRRSMESGSAIAVRR
jgi:general stress protein 26